MQEEYRIIGTAKDLNGIEFVADIEHIKYPFIGYQFHPESNAFGHLPQYSFIDQSKASIRFMNDMMAKVIDIGKQQAKDYKAIPQLIISMTSTKIPSVINGYDGASSVYIERRIMSDRQVKCQT